MNLLDELKKLNKRIAREYNLFYELQKMPDKELKTDMKDSEFDRFTNGTHTEAQCIALYRAKCRGRMITAGNINGEIRLLINMHK